jgi:hypothetical protein
MEGWMIVKKDKNEKLRRIIDLLCGTGSTSLKPSMTIKEYAALLHQTLFKVLPDYKKLFEELCRQYPEKDLPLIIGLYKDSCPWVTDVLSRRLQKQKSHTENGRSA